MRIELLGGWAIAAIVAVAGCAASEEPGDTPSGGSGDEAGSAGSAGSSMSGKGGSSAGSGMGGSIAGSSKGGAAAGGTQAGTGGGPTDGGTASAGGAGGEPDPGGNAGEPSAAGAGGEPDPGCSGPEQCDDGNPCTDDACSDTVCVHTPNTAPCAADQDDCTDDVCAAGECTHPSNTAPCEDDNDPCTTDQCTGGFCTHPANNTCQCQQAEECEDGNPCTNDACVDNQCQYTNNSLACTNDQNPCTDDVCVQGACTHGNNTDSCTDDGDACTGDVCAAGKCTHPAIAACCSGDGDCFDANVCTDETCVNHVCQYANNAGSCAGDASPCTLDECGAGQCQHPNNSVCAGGDDVVIFTNRGSKYVVLTGTNLDWTGSAAGTAEVFEKVGEVGTHFKLRAKSSGLYVTLGAGDTLVATADAAGGMLFDAPSCGAQPWVGLNATGDVTGGAWVATDDAGHLISRSNDCGAASDTSWEKFQLLSVTRPCAGVADCDDGNVCTDQACTGGFCVYSDHAGTCADDANACTDDVCTTGTCTHRGNGTCAGPLVTIQANRDGKFVILNAGYLEYTAASAATAEKFELVDQVGTQFKLRASNASFVTLDVNDNLIANANFAGAMSFDAPVCDVKVGLIALGDDDAQKYVAADAGSRLVARTGNCGLGNAGAWEKFALVAE
jgi:hypothetical protein